MSDRHLTLCPIQCVQMKVLRFDFTPLTLVNYMNHLKWEHGQLAFFGQLLESGPGQAGSHPEEDHTSVSQQPDGLLGQAESSLAQPAKWL